MPVDSAPLVADHVDKVQKLMARGITELQLRAANHDASKFLEPEKAYYDHGYDPKNQHPYGSKDYYRVRDEMWPGISHHYQNNDHHPEHFPNGMEGMSLFSMFELMMDWIASAEYGKYQDGDVMKSIDHNAARFGIPPMLVNIMKNTVLEMREKKMLPPRGEL